MGEPGGIVATDFLADTPSLKIGCPEVGFYRRSSMDEFNSRRNDLMLCESVDSVSIYIIFIFVMAALKDECLS